MSSDCEGEGHVQVERLLIRRDLLCFQLVGDLFDKHVAICFQTGYLNDPNGQLPVCGEQQDLCSQRQNTSRGRTAFETLFPFAVVWVRNVRLRRMGPMSIRAEEN